jgi:hypothetical protein
MPPGSARGELDGYLQGFLVGRKRLVSLRWAGRQSCAQWPHSTKRLAGTPCPFLEVKQTFSIRAQACASDPQQTSAAHTEGERVGEEKSSSRCRFP